MLNNFEWKFHHRVLLLFSYIPPLKRSTNVCCVAIRVHIIKEKYFEWEEKSLNRIFALSIKSAIVWKIQIQHHRNWYQRTFTRTKVSRLQQHVISSSVCKIEKYGQTQSLFTCQVRTHDRGSFRYVTINREFSLHNSRARKKEKTFRCCNKGTRAGREIFYLTFLCNFILLLAGGVTSTLILHPLDLIKIRFAGELRVLSVSR